MIGENGVDMVGHCLQQALEKLPSGSPVSGFDQLGDGELGCPVDPNEPLELPFGGLHFRDVDVKEPDGIALELGPPRFVTLDVGQTRDAMTLQAPCSGRDFPDRAHRIAVA